MIKPRNTPNKCVGIDTTDSKIEQECEVHRSDAHVYWIDTLQLSYFELKRQAAAGVISAFRETGMLWLNIASRSVASSAAFSNGGVRTDGFRGIGCNGSSSAGCHRPISIILILRTVYASPAEARAGCGKCARPDLCGGDGVIRIPTATT